MIECVYFEFRDEFNENQYFIIYMLYYTNLMVHWNYKRSLGNNVTDQKNFKLC